MDTTLLGPFLKMAESLGVPAGWIAGTIPVVIGYVNTFKALFPNVTNSYWYPVIAAVVSFAYAVALLPDWSAVLVGSLVLWGAQWLIWIGLKTAAAKLNLRDK